MNLNLQQQKTGNEVKTQDQPWYGQTVDASSGAPVQSPQPQQAQTVAQTVAQARYTPEAVERLIAKASLLQDTYRQTLSPDQIEAIAAEVGIQPEFIQAAMAQEQQATASAFTPHSEVQQYASVGSEVLQTRQQTIAAIAASYGTIAGYSLVTALLLAMQANLASNLIAPLVFVIPAFMALGLGITSRRRRWGATSGAVLAISVIFAVMIGTGFHGTINPADLRIFALMIGAGAVLGVVGAEGRRLVSKRQVSNRSKRTINRERAL